MLSLWDPEAQDMSDEANRRKSLRLTAKMGLLVALFSRTRDGKEFLTPNPDKGIAWNFLYLLKGSEPDPEFVKIFVALALAKYLSLPDIDFRRTGSQLRAAALVLFPAILCIGQSETGLALVYTSFFLVMYREGLPASIPLIAILGVILVVASILLPPNLLAILLTAGALIALYLLRRTIKRHRGILTSIILIWFVAVGIQRFAVPFLFKNVLQKHQVERIYDLFGKDNPYRQGTDTLAPAVSLKKKETGSSYNVRAVVLIVNCYFSTASPNLWVPLHGCE
jgi:hypothetical protein